MAEGRSQSKAGGGSGTTEATAEDPKPTTETNREDGRYEVDYLVANAMSLLDSRPAIVAGALAAEDRKTHTLEQAQKLLKDYSDAEHDPNEGIA